MQSPRPRGQAHESDHAPGESGAEAAINDAEGIVFAGSSLIGQAANRQTDCSPLVVGPRRGAFGGLGVGSADERLGGEAQAEALDQSGDARGVHLELVALAQAA